MLCGRSFGLVLYACSSIVAAAVVLWFYFQGYGAWVLLACLPLLRSAFMVRQLRGATEPQAFLFALKGAGQVVAGYGLLFSLGLIL